MKESLVVLIISVIVAVVWLQCMNYPGAFQHTIDDVIYWSVALVFIVFPSLIYYIVKNKNVRSVRN